MQTRRVLVRQSLSKQSVLRICKYSYSMGTSDLPDIIMFPQSLRAANLCCMVEKFCELKIS